MKGSLPPPGLLHVHSSHHRAAIQGFSGPLSLGAGKSLLAKMKEAPKTSTPPTAAARAVAMGSEPTPGTR